MVEPNVQPISQLETWPDVQLQHESPGATDRRRQYGLRFDGETSQFGTLKRMYCLCDMLSFEMRRTVWTQLVIFTLIHSQSTIIHTKTEHRVTQYK